jgi:hypothetical protein
LAIFRQRYSGRQILLLFTLVAFPVHIWTIYNLLLDIPSLILYLSTWEVISSIGYTLAFAFIETLIIYLPLLLLGMFFPKHWMKHNYVALASIWLVTGMIMTLLLQFSIHYDWPRKGILVSIPFALGAATVLGLRFPKISQSVLSIAERLTILTFTYVVFDLAGVVLVLARNI